MNPNLHSQRTRILRDERDTHVGAVTSALLNRFNPRQHALGAQDPGRQYASWRLMELARDCAERAGHNVRGLSPHRIVRAALHTTSDFPKILENVISKALRDRYELAPRTFLPLATETTIPDYKVRSVTQLGEAPKLEKVLEGGEYTYGTVGDAAETYRLIKYGKALSISAESIINDDLDAFTRLPAAMGAAAAQLENEVFWTHFTSNPNMHDSTALFHADHGNLAGSGAAISVTALGAGRSAMRQQKGLDGEHILNTQPAFMVVPAALETIGEQFISQNLRADSAGNVNPFAGRLQLISEPRLDADSTTAWYLWADPRMIDTFEYAYLQGEEGPQIETEDGFDVDGVKFKVRHSFAAKAIDWRGLYKNAGA